MAFAVKAGGTWRTSDPYVKDAGAWKSVAEAWVRDAGAWKKFYGKPTVTVAGSNITTTAGAKAVTFTPAVGDVLFALVTATGVASGGAGETLTDNQGGTWTAQIGGSVASTTRFMGFRYRQGKVTAAVSHTVTFTPNTGDTGGGLIVFRIAGMSDNWTLKQTGTINDGATGAGPHLVAMSFQPMAQSCLIGALASGLMTGQAVPTGWTSDLVSNYGTPAHYYTIGHINSDEPNQTIGFIGSATTPTCAVVAEIIGWP